MAGYGLIHGLVHRLFLTSLFSFERRVGKGGHDKIFKEYNYSNVSDPPPSRVSAEDVRLLCKNVIDLCPVHPVMLYEIGLTTIWKHVGHHPAFKDGEGNVAANMSKFLKFPMARGVRIGHGTALRPNKEAKDKTVGKRPGHVGTSGRTKKRKITPLSMALSESEAKGSSQGDYGTFHFVTRINTFNPVNTDAEARGGNQALQSDGRVEEEAVDASNNNETILKNFCFYFQRVRSSHFPGRNSGGDEGANLQTHLSPLMPLWYEALNDDYGELLVEALRTRETLLEDHKALQQIKRLEDALASKTSSLSEAEKTATQLKGDLERLTVDLSQAEVVRYNYVRQLLPTVIYRLLSIDEYKKSLYEPFNRAIAVGWAKGVKVDQTKEEARAILADADD
ncbi:hypothetical protein Tco_0179541 [Tanacetum coccineum]